MQRLLIMCSSCIVVISGWKGSSFHIFYVIVTLSFIFQRNTLTTRGVKPGRHSHLRDYFWHFKDLKDFFYSSTHFRVLSLRRSFRKARQPVWPLNTRSHGDAAVHWNVFYTPVRMQLLREAELMRENRGSGPNLDPYYSLWVIRVTESLSGYFSKYPPIFLYHTPLWWC